MTELSEGDQRDLTLQDAVTREMFTRSCVGFFDPEDSGWEGSGTLVRVGERCFIATAGHVAEALGARSEARMCHGVDPAEEERSDYLVSSIARELKTGKPRDVGSVELEPVAVANLEANGMSFLEPAQLAPNRPAEMHQCWLTGAPVAYRDRAREERGVADVHGIVALRTYAHDECVHLDDEEVQGYSSGERDDNYHVNWGEGLDGDGVYRALMVPHGMSGGGLWTIRELPDEVVWSARKAIVLLGIAWFYRPDKRCIQCVPIAHWLRLIKGNP